MQKVFFRNLAFLITVNLIIKPLWIFGIDRTVQNVVGAESYGLYFVITSLSMLTQILLDLGISNYNNRLIAQNEEMLNSHLPNILSTKLVLSIFYLAITLVAAVILNYHGHELYLLVLICFNQILASLIIYVRSNISALHRFVVDSIFSVLDKGLMIVMCGLLLLIPFYRSRFIIDWFIYAQMVAYLVTLASALVYVLRITGKIRINFSPAFSKQLLKNAFPFAALIALMMLYGRIDAQMIKKLLPAEGVREAGFYAAAFRLLDALNQFGYLFSVLLLPIFSRMLARKQSIDQLVRTSFTAIFIFASICCLALSFYSTPVMQLLYHENPIYSAEILRVLIFSFVGTSSVYIFGTLLTANGNLKELVIVSAIAVLSNIILNLLLIPEKKAVGAAESSLITQLLIAVLNFGVAFKVFKWKANLVYLLRLGTYTLLAFALFYASHFIEAYWLVPLTMACAAVLLLSFLVKLIQVKGIYTLFTQD